MLLISELQPVLYKISVHTSIIQLAYVSRVQFSEPEKRQMQRHATSRVIEG